jgi:hypothetical protein
MIRIRPLALAVVAVLALGCNPASPPSGAQLEQAPAGEASPGPAQLAQDIDAAFLAAYARYEQSRSRYGAVEHPLNPTPTRANEAFTHRRALIGPDDRQVTTPNNDTLYSAGWAELSRGPVQVQVPAIPAGRYWSLAVLDIDTDNIAIFGSGSDTATPLSLVLVPPGWVGGLPAGAVRVDAPGNDVQVLVRILVDGADDAAAVHALQAGISMAPLDGSAPQPMAQALEPTSARDPANFLAVVNESLARNPAADAERWAGWRSIGVGVDAPAFDALPAEVQAAWRERIGALNDGLRDGLGRGAREVGGWRLPDPDVGRFGADDGLRAAVAYGALGALASSEALYLQMDADPATGEPLDGRTRWTLDVPAIDARGFWSISLYEVDAEGRMYFTPNAIQRQSVGDRTPGLVRRSDGQMTLHLQHAAPEGKDAANWLPTPDGPFAMVLRVYLPSDAMRTGEAPLPVLRRAQ